MNTQSGQNNIEYLRTYMALCTYKDVIVHVLNVYLNFNFWYHPFLQFQLAVPRRSPGTTSYLLVFPYVAPAHHWM